jgi:hypothetical protein
VVSCPECSKVLNTISGFRGHVNKQHNIDARATDNKVTASGNKSVNTFSCQDDNFSKIFPADYQSSLKKIANDPLLPSKQISNRNPDIVLRTLLHSGHLYLTWLLVFSEVFCFLDGLLVSSSLLLWSVSYSVYSPNKKSRAMSLSQDRKSDMFERLMNVQLIY